MRFHLLATVVSLALTADALPARAQAEKSPANKSPANEPLADKAADNQPADEVLAEDLKLLQGTWELSQTPFSKAALDELQQKYPKLLLNR
jgi:hypothetical protein